MAKEKPTKMLAVLGRSRRGGRWSIASQSSVLACLGTCHLDMRLSTVNGEQFKMKVTVVLGTATFILPPGAIVKPSGLTMLATSLVDVPETDDPCVLPVLEIEWTTILGRIRIVTDTTEEIEEVEAIEAIEERSAVPAPAVALPGPPAPVEVSPVSAAAAMAAPAIPVQTRPAPAPVMPVAAQGPAREPDAEAPGQAPRAAAVAGPADDSPATASAVNGATPAGAPDENRSGQPAEAAPAEAAPAEAAATSPSRVADVPQPAMRP